MKRVSAVLARGGSSRGLLIREEDLAGMDEAERHAAFAFAVGSPDPDARQVNGVGGGNATTSKVAIVSKSVVPGHDVDYTFFQVIVSTGISETRGTCGNLVASVGQFAVEHGYVAAVAPTTTVTIHDVNTGQTLAVDVPVKDGKVVYEGNHAIAGVPGTGAPVPVRFMEPAGRVTGKLLPTGQLLDRLSFGDVALDLTLIDTVSPVVLIHATSMPAGTSWTVAAIEKDAALGALLEQVRGWAAVKFGLAKSADRAGLESPFYPFVGMYWDRQMPPIPGLDVDAKADAVVRLMSGGAPHRAVPLSAGLATATLARLRALAGGNATTSKALVRLQHASGIIEIDVETEPAGPTVRSVGVTQTARPIMAGEVFFP